MAHPLYVDWMKKFVLLNVYRVQGFKQFESLRFGPSTQHMVLNDLCSSLDTEAVHRAQAARNLIHPFIFPLLPHSVYPESHFINSKDHLVIKNEDKNSVHYASTNTKYLYRPTSERPFAEDQCLHLDTNKFLKDTLNESAQEFLKVWKKNYEGIERKLATPEDPEIVFLGTGSAVPYTYRNVSCIMVNVGEEASIILDCGENSCGQLYRLYGPEESEKKLMKLKAIFISHLHADHHLGLIGIAINRKKCFDARGIDYENLIVVGPGDLLEWYSAISGHGIPVKKLISFVPVERLLENSKQPKSYNKLLDLFGFEKVQTVRVQHSQSPHGVVLKHKKGWKIVYSGDTMPSHELIRAGHDCDLLIHEATFDSSKIDEARFKRHSTSEQAIEVGRKMKAKFIMLTHFSQKYDKVPLFSKDFFSDDVGIAFDNMIVKLSDFHQLPKFMPAYEVVYEKENQKTLRNIENKWLRVEIAKGLV